MGHFMRHRTGGWRQSEGANFRIECALRICWKMRGNLQLYHVSDDFLRFLFAADHLKA
jgi:hypothetical protein